MTIKQIKKELGINDSDLAEMAGYSSVHSYRNNSAKPRFENFVIKFYDLMKTKTGQKNKPDVPDKDG